ncbi:Beta-arrestin-1 [Clonorchis sinensis]|uniref:Beta-arrestin-1 n=1 Tax=Clonorchis sinensis TaxID=79923 RepID=A0A8T1LX10_CLOSI|nr:Beta-arrestin-1 [Clonorchis sinensis]
MTPDAERFFLDGLLSFDTSTVEGHHVYLILTCGCRYGREDLDVLGLTLRKDLLMYTKQMWPIGQEQGQIEVKRRTRYCRRRRREESETNLDRLGIPQGTADTSKLFLNEEQYCSDSQEEILTKDFHLSLVQRRLVTKLGAEGHPFRICLPPFSPCSVTVQPMDEDMENLCGVTYDVCAFIGKRLTDVNKMSCVSMLIRKLTRGPPIDLRPIQTTTCCGSRPPVFSCLGDVTMCATLDKTLYYHGEDITIDVGIENLSRCSVRKVRVNVVQVAELYMLTKGSFRTLVVKAEHPKGLPIRPGTTDWKQTFVLRPMHDQKGGKRSLVLDGLLKQEKVSLASSSIYRVPDNDCRYYQLMRSVFGEAVYTNATRVVKDLQGIFISYVVQCRCWMGLSSLTVELPFFLMHPTPESEQNVKETTTNRLSETSLDDHVSTVLAENTIRPIIGEERPQSESLRGCTVPARAPDVSERPVVD